MVYTFVFSEIFQAKWGGGSTNKLEFAVVIFCGLTTYNLFGEVISRAPSLVLSNPNYVKKVVFPLELFSIISVGSTLVTASINFGLVMIFAILFLKSLSWTVLLLPLLIVPLLLLSLGMSWILSSLGIFLRDIGQIIGIVVQALSLLSPIFYSVSVIPEKFRWFYNLNPLTYYIENVRSVLLWGEIPQINGYIVQLIIAVIVCLLGLLFFRKTKSGFADVL
jgi:lipopolysaccharide transport system permease protein